jgi:hypothetical protein
MQFLGVVRCATQREFEANTDFVVKAGVGRIRPDQGILVATNINDRNRHNNHEVLEFPDFFGPTAVSSAQHHNQLAVERTPQLPEHGRDEKRPRDVKFFYLLTGTITDW